MARKLSGEEKAVILLRAIGEDAAAQVLKCLEPKEIRKIGALMKETANITREEEEEVIAEFEKASASGEIGFEGKEYIKSVLTKALGPEKAARILESLTSASYPGLEALKWVDAKTVAQLVKVEHPQTVAVILAHMDPEQASQVLAGLPETLRADVALRLATMEEVRPEVLQDLSEAVQESLLAGTGSRAMSIGGAEVIADILARLDKGTESAILAKIAERDQILADSIRALMFVFDDLIKLDDRSVQELLKEVGKEDLPLALRGASPEVKEKFFRNMSARAAQMLKDDMEARGPVKLSEVEKAQQNILKVCRKLEEEGRIVIAGQGEELV
ncbi:MAG TPA: flagellar motor switch protein FliG [Nitrospiraceae bacterium]|jgi:flagellar motor switch protein FliG|nr:flagellar motor switch protein FliG [Nitrospiraceae bacterium]